MNKDGPMDYSLGDGERKHIPGCSITKEEAPDGKFSVGGGCTESSFTTFSSLDFFRRSQALQRIVLGTQVDLG